LANVCNEEGDDEATGNDNGNADDDDDADEDDGNDEVDNDGITVDDAAINSANLSLHFLVCL